MKKIMFLLMLLVLSAVLIGCKTKEAVNSGTNLPEISKEESAIGSDAVNTDLEDLDSLDSLDEELEEDLLADLDDVDLE